MARVAALGLACTAAACFEDAPIVNGSTETSAADGETSADGSGDAPVGCQGCLDAAGGCLAGNLDQACGALAMACVACPEGTQCGEGECVEIPACGAENCDGCCDGDDCRAGSDAAACGAGGLQCAACPDGSSCVAGSCALPCAASCDGCCSDAGECVSGSGQSAAQCGVEAEACVACTAGFDCVDGSCLSTACIAECDGCCDGDVCMDGLEADACGQAGSACQACPLGTSCGGAGCAPDRGSLWEILAIDAVTSETDLSGGFWDIPGGLPDPYLVITVDGMEAETSAAANTTLPTWNEVVHTGLTVEQLQASWEIAMVDEDPVVDESMAACDTSIPDDAFGQVLVAECGTKELTVWTLTFAILPAQG